MTILIMFNRCPAYEWQSLGANYFATGINVGKGGSISYGRLFIIPLLMEMVASSGINEGRGVCFIWRMKMVTKEGALCNRQGPRLTCKACGWVGEAHHTAKDIWGEAIEVSLRRNQFEEMVLVWWVGGYVGMVGIVGWYGGLIWWAGMVCWLCG